MTFLFDIGRVLLDFDFEGSLSRLFPNNAVNVGGRLERLHERKDEFEAGKVDEQAFIAWAIKTLDIHATPSEFHHAWQNIFSLNVPMWQCVKKLADSGHRLILFSNTNSIHWPWMTEAFPEFAIFDGAVVSFETGSVKPDTAIYQHAIIQHNIIPEDTIYIDDLPNNIAKGRELGFRTWQYDLNNHAAFEAWLASELIDRSASI